jgi:hypothetical protein
LMGEVLEREGRHSDAITWAQAELQVDPPFCCCVTSFTQCSDFNACRMHLTSMRRQRPVRGACSADVMRY